MAQTEESTPPQTPRDDTNERGEQNDQNQQNGQNGQDEHDGQNGMDEQEEQEFLKPEKPIYELLTHTLVDIYVGSEGTAYTLHEKLLCYHSAVLRQHFYSTKTRNTSYGLPDEDTQSFELLVGWLYSRTLNFPVEDKQVSTLLDLYLLAERLQISALETDCVDTVRAFYHSNESYPELRRVQYIYSNTEADNPMREMMVGSVARFLTLGEQIPKHWESALKRDGTLAVDIIRAIQEWHLEGRSVPDAREGSIKGFSRLEGSDMGDTASVAPSTNY